MNTSGLLVIILVFVLIGYFLGRISSKKASFLISLSIGVISIVVLYLLVGLSYFDVPSHRFTIEDYFAVVKGAFLTLFSVLVGRALGVYFKNKRKSVIE